MVVEALEGLEGAADAPVAVGAQKAVTAGPVDVVLAAAMGPGALFARLKEEVRITSHKLFLILSWRYLWMKRCVVTRARFHAPFYP